MGTLIDTKATIGFSSGVGVRAPSRQSASGVPGSPRPWRDNSMMKIGRSLCLLLLALPLACSTKSGMKVRRRWKGCFGHHPGGCEAYHPRPLGRS
jgi:hypothetical protein